MAVITKRIENSMDNAYMWPGDNTWYNEGLEMGMTSFGAENGFLRWRNITIPQGATIVSAYVTLSKWYDGEEDLSLRVYGIDEDNTADFTNDATGRALTTAYVDFPITTDWVTDTEKTSPDLKDIIQEIVNRASWASGNALGLRINDIGSTAGNYGPFNAYPNESTLAPQITITYSVGSPSSSVSPSVSPSSSLSPSASWSPSPSASPSPSSSESPSISASLSPSSSISPSSSVSPSLSPSSSASPSPEDYGFKVAKPGIGKDVQDITDPKEFIFTSAKGVLGLRELATITDTTDVDGNIAKTVAHGIGYVPITLVAFITYDDKKVMMPLEWHSFDFNGLGELVETTEIGSFKMDATNIYINLHIEQYNWDTDTGSNVSGRSYSFKVYYYFNEITDNV